MHFLPLGEKPPYFFPAPSQRIIIISNRIHSQCRNTQYDLSEGITWDSKKSICSAKKIILKSFCKLSWQRKLFSSGRKGEILQGSASPLLTEQTNTPIPPPLSLFPIASSFRAESFSEVLIWKWMKTTLKCTKHTLSSCSINKLLGTGRIKSLWGQQRDPFIVASVLLAIFDCPRRHTWWENDIKCIQMWLERPTLDQLRTCSYWVNYWLSFNQLVVGLLI